MTMDHLGRRFQPFARTEDGWIPVWQHTGEQSVCMLAIQHHLNYVWLRFRMGEVERPVDDQFMIAEVDPDAPTYADPLPDDLAGVKVVTRLKARGARLVMPETFDVEDFRQMTVPPFTPPVA